MFSGAGLFKDENATGSVASLAGWKLDSVLFKQFKKNDSLNGTQVDSKLRPTDNILKTRSCGVHECR